MSDEFCAGVQILLKRVESHPEDFTQEYGPWKRLMDAVLASKRGGDYDDKEYLKPLTDAEIDALHKVFLPLARQRFDSWVMREILVEPKEEEEENLKYKATERYSHGWTDPRMLQNAIPPGTMISVTAGGGGGSGQVKLGGGGGVLTQNSTQAKPESVMSKLKRELGL
jgi:hypothetical protein